MAFLTLVSRLPWLTHAVTVLLVFGYLLATEINEYGLDRTGRWAPGQLMSGGILVVAVAATVPLALAEVWAVAGDARWVGRLMAVLASAGLAWVAALPLGLRFFASQDPVRQSHVEAAVSSLAALVAGQAAVLLAASAMAVRTAAVT